MDVALALPTRILGSLGFRVSPTKLHMNDALFHHLDRVLHLPLWVDTSRAPTPSTSACAVFESGMWSVASKRETWLDHPRDVFGTCEGKTARTSTTGVPS